jgi:hypothetical protein
MRISLKKVTLALVWGWVILLTLSLLTRYLAITPNPIHHVRMVIAARFDHDGEASLPAWYQGMGLFMCGVFLAAVAARTHQRRMPGATRWAILSGMFALCSADEVAMLHETFGNSLSAHLGHLGFGVYSWILGGIPVVVALAIAFVPLILKMPRAIMITLIVAGIFYVIGAVGFEVIEAKIDALYGTMTFSLVSAVEETFEMIGIILFIRGTLAYAHEIQAFESDRRDRGRPAALRSARGAAPRRDAPLGLTGAATAL